MLSIGIDPGIAHTGLAVLDGDRLALVDVLVTKKQDRLGDTQARLGELLAWVADRVGLFGNGASDVIVVEWPIVGGRNERGPSTARSAAQTFAAAGALIGMLRDRCGTLLAPVPATWRCAIAGGRVVTEDLHAQLERDYHVVDQVGRTRAPHGLDAVGLAIYGQHQLAALAA